MNTAANEWNPSSPVPDADLQVQVTQMSTAIRVSFTYWIKWKYSNVQGLLTGAGDVIPWSDAAILWGKGLNPLLFSFLRCIHSDWRSGTHRSGMAREGSWTFALPPQNQLFGHRAERTGNTARNWEFFKASSPLVEQNIQIVVGHSKQRELAFQVEMKAAEPQTVHAKSWWTPLPFF